MRGRIITNALAGLVNRVHGTLKSLNCDGRMGLALLAACLLLLLPTLGGRAGTAAAALRPHGTCTRGSGGVC